MISRRNFLASSSALFSTWALSGCRSGGASLKPKFASGGEDLKFIFLFNNGGWDTTRVFSPLFDFAANIDHEAAAEPNNFGGIDFVSHPDRPMVDEFFRQHRRRTLILNGVQVPSVDHDVCTRLSYTGNTQEGQPDVASQLAGAFQDKFVLPHVVLSGPAFTGDFGTVVTRTGNGQLDRLLSGSILNQSDLPVSRISPEAEALIDQHLRLKLEGSVKAKKLAAAEKKLTEVYASALDRAKALKDLQEEIDWDPGGDLITRLDLATTALSKGFCRCVSLDFSGSGWDSHANNDPPQNQGFQDLFTALNHLMTSLEAASGPTRNSLANETVVVVFSEMGRTPKLNGDNGKDHWEDTSVMLVGPSLNSNRTLGAFDEFQRSLPVDFASGDVSDKGQVMTSQNICAAILNLGGVDHREFLPGVAPFSAIVG